MFFLPWYPRNLQAAPGYIHGPAFNPHAWLGPLFVGYRDHMHKRCGLQSRTHGWEFVRGQNTRGEAYLGESPVSAVHKCNTLSLGYMIL
jgi:hypothetical protein